MGLDQYVIKKNKLTEETEELMYWRKANFLHKYFTHDYEERGFADDNCTDFSITLDDIKDLKNKCEKALAGRSSDDRADLAELGNNELPTMSGFFFGSTAYDNWYFEDVKETLDFCDRLLADGIGENEELYYYAWY